MVWQYEKFEGDLAIYAFCPNCGFYHDASEFNYEDMKVNIVYEYNYCPNCGIYLHNEDFKKKIEILWNKRNKKSLVKNIFLKMRKIKI